MLNVPEMGIPPDLRVCHPGISVSWLQTVRSAVGSWLCEPSVQHQSAGQRYARGRGGAQGRSSSVNPTLCDGQECLLAPPVFSTRSGTRAFGSLARGRETRTRSFSTSTLCSENQPILAPARQSEMPCSRAPPQSCVAHAFILSLRQLRLLLTLNTIIIQSV